MGLMFPGAHSRVFYNEAGEPLGWDEEVDDGPYADYEEDVPEPMLVCRCGQWFFDGDDDDLSAHKEWCDQWQEPRSVQVVQVDHDLL